MNAHQVPEHAQKVGHCVINYQKVAGHMPLGPTYSTTPAAPSKWELRSTTKYLLASGKKLELPLLRDHFQYLL